jgi:hypothetical protein
MFQKRIVAGISGAEMPDLGFYGESSLAADLQKEWGEKTAG